MKINLNRWFVRAERVRNKPPLNEKHWRVTFHPAGARRSCHRHRGVPEPGGGAAGGRWGWRPRFLHQGFSVPPDFRATHGGQHGPSRPRAHGVHREREHGEKHRAAERQVTLMDAHVKPEFNRHVLGYLKNLNLLMIFRDLLEARLIAKYSRAELFTLLCLLELCVWNSLKV